VIGASALALALTGAGPALPPPDPAACPAATPDGAIVVCRRQRAESPYRPPPARDEGFDPDGAVESVSAERHRLIDGVHDQTRGSCSATGTDGFTGCMIQSWREKGYRRWK
jgi:hypothetical protein